MLTDIPYGVTKYKWDATLTRDQLVLYISKIANLLKDVESAVIKIYCSEEQYFLLKELLQVHFVVLKNPYLWIYSVGYFKV